MGYKTRISYTTGKGQDDCKCFKGSQCANYHKQCADCYKIQGKYTKWKKTY